MDASRSTVATVGGAGAAPTPSALIMASATSAAAPTSSYDVFLSHNWAHKPVVEAFLHRLKLRGVRCWIDKENLGGDLQASIARGIDASSFFLAFLTDNYLDSAMCLREIRYASGRGKRIVLIKLGPLRGDAAWPPTEIGLMAAGEAFEKADSEKWVEYATLWVRKYNHLGANAAALLDPELERARDGVYAELRRILPDADFDRILSKHRVPFTPPPTIAAAKTIPFSEVVETGEVVGEGAYGTVVVAKYRGFRAALKKLPGLAGALEEADIAQIKDEAAIQASLEHVHVARVFGLAVDEPSKRYGIVMQLYSCALDRDFLASSTTIELRLSYVLQIASGLAYLHSENVVHGDVKPSNILVSSGNADVALTDFGFAAVRTGMSIRSKNFSKTGVGTPPFMAPELFEEDDETAAPIHAPSKATDVYAFGITAFCILAGKDTPYPLKDDKGMAIIPCKRVPKGLRPDTSILLAPLAASSALAGASPATALADLLSACWTKDAERRPSMASVHGSLLAAGCGIMIRRNSEDVSASSSACGSNLSLPSPLVSAAPAAAVVDLLSESWTQDAERRPSVASVRGSLHAADRGNTNRQNSEDVSPSSSAFGGSSPFLSPLASAAPASAVIIGASSPVSAVLSIGGAGVANARAAGAVMLPAAMSSSSACDNHGRPTAARTPRMSVGDVYTVTTIAGRVGVKGSENGDALSVASFHDPYGVVYSAKANTIFIVDHHDCTIRALHLPTASVSTLAGKSGERGAVDGVGAAARFYCPIHLALNKNEDRLYVTDDKDIRAIDLHSKAVTTIAVTVGSLGRDTCGIVVNPANDKILYVASSKHKVCALHTSSGVVTHLAGSTAEEKGNADGVGKAARFSFPNAIAATSCGRFLFIADCFNHVIRRLEVATRAVTWICGSGRKEHVDGCGKEACSIYPSGLALSSDDSVLYLADSHSVRSIELARMQVTTIAGGPEAGCADGVGTIARFKRPQGLAVLPAEPDGSAGAALVVADSENGTVRLIGF